MDPLEFNKDVVPLITFLVSNLPKEALKFVVMLIYKPNSFLVSLCQNLQQRLNKVIFILKEIRNVFVSLLMVRHRLLELILRYLEPLLLV